MDGSPNNNQNFRTPSRQGTPRQANGTETNKKTNTPMSNGSSIRTTRSRSALSGIQPLNSPAAQSRVSSLGLDSLSPASKASADSPRRNPTFGTLGADIDLRSPLNYGTPSKSSTDKTPKTPIRLRANVNNDRVLRQINVGPGSVSGSEGPNLFIWGTVVNSNEFREKFKRFLTTFIPAQHEENEEEMMEDDQSSEATYLRKIKEIQILEDPFLNINCAHIQEFNDQIFLQLKCYPQELIPIMDMVVNEIFFSLFPDSVLDHQIQVRPFNIDKSKTMRFLNPDDIDQLVTINGMVIRSSNIIPEMQKGHFKCTVCYNTAAADIERGKITEPTLCIKCNTSYSFTLIHNRSTFNDKQMVRLQEDLEDTPVGETPAMVQLFAHQDLVNKVQPGDRISISGIYRAAPLRAHPKQRLIRSVYKTHLDVVHYKRVNNKKLRELDDRADRPELKLSDERIAQIMALSKKEDVYERLARALAPSIYEHEDVKKGILLQLFGGTKKDFKNVGRGRFRAEVNILLCGDPGTSKSQLLKYVYDLIPRSQYTSGKGSSAVGLTAYVAKDPETRQIILQTGALVMADNGVCCIDEFDKMSDQTRSVLHEVMEQQTLSIAKAGIICQLNARSSVLAAANPKESQWNKFKTIVENVNLPHTLLSRFDLIFLLLDPQNDTYDRRLAKHMISLYFSKPEESELTIDISLLRDYISYARENIHPKITEEAGIRLADVYTTMRKNSGRGQISAFARQLESLIRLSEAHAKVRLSQEVEVVDVEEAWRIYREALKQAATDPLTGKIDISIISTGISSLSRKKRDDLKAALKKLLESKGKALQFNWDKIFKEAKETLSTQVTKEMFYEALQGLQDDGVVVIGKSMIRLVRA